MELAQLVPLVLKVSIGLIVTSVAMTATPGDVTSLLRRPALLVRSLLAMNVVMPALAVAMAAAFGLKPALEVALILLAVSPVPPILPKKQIQTGGDRSYALGLLGVSAAVSLVSVPATVTIIGNLLGRPVQVPIATIVPVIATSILLPLFLGRILGRMVGAGAERWAKPLGTLGTVLLLVTVLPVLAVAWRPVFGMVGDWTLVAIVLFVLAGLLVGHLLGGPEPADRTVLALSTASRHPGVAVAVASAIAPPEHRLPLAAAVVLCVLAGAVVTAPYVKWRQKTPATAGPTTG
jgi:BASS family bile acid:Na+ symporter